MSDPAFSLCVYLGSRPGNNPLFIEAAKQAGQWIGLHQGQLVYGGGNSGLMGVLAQATKAAGGRVVGIIPRALVNKELANHDCDELHVVDTMHERKAMMAERSDAFLALPGGIGTLEELFEVWTWRQLGYHDKPIGVLDADGYYRQMLGFLQHSVESGFMGQWQMELVRVGSEVPALLAALVQEAGLPREAKPLRSVI